MTKKDTLKAAKTDPITQKKETTTMPKKYFSITADKNPEGLHITTNTDKRYNYPYFVAFDPIESFKTPAGSLNNGGLAKVKDALSKLDVQARCLERAFIWVQFKLESEAGVFTTFLDTLKRDTDW